MTAALDDLLARLEAATEGSEAFDVEIAHKIGMARQAYNEDGVADDIVYDPPYPGGQPRCRPLRYTRSLDAALTLVPEGAFVEVNGPRKYLNIPTVVPNFWLAKVWHGPQFHAARHDGWGATEPLARCIAALRARQVQS